MNRDIENMRVDYIKGDLHKEDLHKDPILLFNEWFEEARNAGQNEPNIMTLATVNDAGIPDARIVLLKGIEGGQFIFYTNYESKKGSDLATNDQACLVFHWAEIERQVRIRGKVSKINIGRSAAYFSSRPRGSQVGAWASPQSQVIADRSELKNKVDAIMNQYKEKDSLPLPPHWGGYQVDPYEIEFWQGRKSRLHDRFLYCKVETEWKVERLAP